MYHNVELFVEFNNDIGKLQALLDIAKNFNYVMASDFNHNIPTAAELYNTFKKYYHGNSKMLLNFYYNPITDRKEISYGTRSIYRTYPQYKNMRITKL